VRADERDKHDDDQLAVAAGRGDRAALDALLRRHMSLIHGICRRILAHPDDALDATQEALLAIARGIHSFDGRARFTTWCYRVTTNAALDEARRRSRRPRPVETVPDAVAGGGPGIDDRVADQLAIDAALAQLPAEFRAAVALRDLGGLDYAQIAEILDVPPGTVRSRIARGRAALADLLGNRDGTSDHPTSRTS
jgi:RNA polymerase sigma-70 factor (ECF subfamily)